MTPQKLRRRYPGRRVTGRQKASARRAIEIIRLIKAGRTIKIPGNRMKSHLWLSASYGPPFVSPRAALKTSPMMQAFENYTKMRIASDPALRDLDEPEMRLGLPPGMIIIDEVAERNPQMSRALEDYTKMRIASDPALARLDGTETLLGVGGMEWLSVGDLKKRLNFPHGENPIKIEYLPPLNFGPPAPVSPQEEET